MSNTYSSSGHACCNICGHIWKMLQAPEKENCSLCQKILNDYPEIWDWIFGVIKKKIAAHESGDH